MGQPVTAASAGTTSYLTAATLRVMAADGVEYAYRDVGEPVGRALIALQHFRGNLDNWDPALIDTLAQHRRVITVDYRGVGGSTGRPADTVEQIARDVLPLPTQWNCRPSTCSASASEASSRSVSR